MIPNYGLYPQQQSRLNYLEAQMNTLRGRPVSSLDEVRAVPIDFDGSVFYFPDLSNNRIYTKQIDLNGQAVFKMYKLTEIPAATNYTDSIGREEFNKVITDINAQLAALKQGGIANEQHDAVF